jgi:hypothetical protein
MIGGVAAPSQDSPQHRREEGASINHMLNNLTESGEKLGQDRLFC